MKHEDREKIYEKVDTGLRGRVRIRSEWIVVFVLGCEMMFNSSTTYISLNPLIEWRTKVYTDTFKFCVLNAASVKKANRMPAKIRGNINNR